MEDYSKYKDEKLAELSEPLVTRAVDCLVHIISNQDKYDLLKLYEEDPNEKWFVGQHFGYGMYIRNQLRSAGITDDLLPDRNWDDYYIQILEIAIGIRTNPFI